VSARAPMAVSPRSTVATRAMLGGDPGDKPKITRENEGDAWLSKAEREGKSTMQDPVTIVGAIIFFFPFFGLLVALLSGAVDFDAINSY